jgi:hypothetical protein
MMKSIRMKKRFIYSKKDVRIIAYPFLSFPEEVIRERLEFSPKEDMDHRVAPTEQKSENH